MHYDSSTDSFAKDVRDFFFAMVVGLVGTGAFIAVFALLQFCVNGEITLFTDNFWFKEQAT